jgi:CHASE3 domain sensor protein
VQVPANLLFSLAILLLLGVALHLSWELSQAEDEIRRVAEETAISSAVIDQLRNRVSALEARLDADTESAEN